MERRRGFRGGDVAKGDCENKGCIFVQNNRFVDIEVDGKRINCKQGHSHPLTVWRVKNDSGKNGYVIGHKMDFKSPNGNKLIKSIKAIKHKFNVDNHQYEAMKAEKRFKLYETCVDVACYW